MASLVQPEPLTAEGPPPSVTQWTKVPLSSFTSNSIRMWGLAQLILVTTACFNSTSLVLSYATLPWCASSGAETAKRTATKANEVISLGFMRHSFEENSDFATQSLVLMALQDQANQFVLLLLIS